MVSWALVGKQLTMVLMVSVDTVVNWYVGNYTIFVDIDRQVAHIRRTGGRVGGGRGWCGPRRIWYETTVSFRDHSHSTALSVMKSINTNRNPTEQHSMFCIKRELFAARFRAMKQWRRAALRPGDARS